MSHIRIAALGDIHYGHPKIDPIKLYTSLHKHFFPVARTCDMVVIVGDFFDSLLDLSSHATLYALHTLRDLISLHKEVRFLSGTYSHDRQQYQIFQALLQDADMTQVRWYKDITAEILTVGTSMYTLAYVPDNLQGMDKYDVLDILQKKLQDLDRPRYDIIFGHGTFDFALPYYGVQFQHGIYSSGMFDDITDLVIFGHIHTPCHQGKVYYTGSFERFQHNEEETKGFLVLEHTQNKWKVTRIPNKDSTLFLTYTIHTNMDIQEHMQHFKNWIKNTVGSSSTGTSPIYIRIIFPVTEAALVIKEAITSYIGSIDMNGNIRLSFKQNKESMSTDSTSPIHLEEVAYEEFLASIPTPANVHEHIHQYLMKLPEYDEHLLSVEEIQRIIGGTG